jgi:polygalacturonase
MFFITNNTFPARYSIPYLQVLLVLVWSVAPQGAAAAGWEEVLLTRLTGMADSLTAHLLPKVNTERYYYVEDFGAIADGETLNTASIQQAIDACHMAGGGVVLFSKGWYLTGTVYLKSNVVLEVAESAVILGSRNHERDYPASPVTKPYINPETGFQYMNNPNPDNPHHPVNNANPKRQALIIAIRQENIGIIGKGTIDFQGYKWHPLYVLTKNSTGRHPFGIIMMECKNVYLKDIFLKNANKWMQVYVNSENLLFDGIKVLNQVSFENDGLDMDGCRNVIVRNGVFSTEDDGLCLKGMSGLVSENILIENCVIYSQCNAFKIGTDTQGDFKNILVRNCVLGGIPPDSTSLFKYRRTRRHGVDSGFAIEAVDGGTTEDIVIQNCTILRANTPIFLRSGRRNRTSPQRPDPIHGTLRKILITDIKGYQCEKDGSFISGIRQSHIHQVTIRNYELYARGIRRKVDRKIREMEDGYPDANQFNWLGLGFPAYGFWIRNAKDIKFENIRISPSISNSKRPCIQLAENTHNITIDGTLVDGQRFRCDGGSSSP